MPFQGARHTANRAACTYSRYKYVHLSVRIRPDFLARSKFVYPGVGRVLELLQNHGAGYLVPQFLRLGNRTRHACQSVRQHDFRSEGFQQVAAFDAHGFGHGQYQMIAFNGSHHCQPYSRIAAGRLYNGGAGLQRSARFGILDHRQPYAVFYAACGIKGLQFGNHLPLQSVLPAVPRQFHQRRTADKFRQVIRYFRHNSSEFIQNKTQMRRHTKSRLAIAVLLTHLLAKVGKKRFALSFLNKD